MGIAELTDRSAVLAAMAEFDDMGRDGFLERYGFGRATGYVVVHGGKEYDSKAIVGVAFGIQHPDRGPLSHADFNGGAKAAAKRLEALGFEVSKPGRRNPDWTVDELILAMDLYLRFGTLGKRHPEVLGLSRILNELPIHVGWESHNFRNGDGVALKLANFAAIDPDWPGKGMQRGGKLEQKVWANFTDRRDVLHALAERIRAGAVGSGEAFPDVPEPDEVEVEEGALVYRRHRRYERDRKVVEAKKRAVRKAGLPLACEVCGMDFEAVYGELGRDYIECHHLVPLSESGATRTKTSDLALLCANCHRMMHRGRPWPTVAELRGTVMGRSG